MILEEGKENYDEEEEECDKEGVEEEVERESVKELEQISKRIINRKKRKTI